MANEFRENDNENKTLKLVVIPIILGITIMALVGISLYKQNNLKKTELVSNKTTLTSVGLSTAEISKNIINWTDKQRDSRGVYSENEICEKGVCSTGLSSNRSGFSVLDGKVKYENKIDKSVVSDLTKYADNKVVQVIQSNYLICNFLYDLYNYPNASDEIKNLTEKICFNIQYELATREDWDSIYNTESTVDTASLLNKNLQKFNEILVEKKATSSPIVDNFNAYKNYGYFVSEFATRYKWKGKYEDYKGFMVSLNKFLDLYSDDKNQFNEGEGCGLALGLIDMGESKQLSEFKKYGELLYSQEVINQDINKMTVRQMLTCGLVASKMNDKKMVNNFVDKIITNFYNKDKGCLGEQSLGSLINVYDVKNNGMFLILLNNNIGEN